MPKNNGEARNDRVSKFLSYLVAIATILGIPTGLYGYFSAEHGKRVEKTFEFYKDFRGDLLQKNWLEVIGAWNGKADQAKTLQEKGDEDGIRQLATTIVTAESGAKAFSELLDFFDGLSACVESSLCDRNATVSLFHTPAYQLASAFGSHILYVRETFRSQRYASGLFKVRALQNRFSVF